MLEDQWEVEERRAQAPTHFFFEEVSPLLGSPFSLLCHTCCPLQSPPPPHQCNLCPKRKMSTSLYLKKTNKRKKTKSKKCFIFSFFESIISFQNNYFVYLVLSFHGLFYGWEIEIYLFCFNSVLYRTSCICFCFSFLVLSVLS